MYHIYYYLLCYLNVIKCPICYSKCTISENNTFFINLPNKYECKPVGNF